MKNSLHYLKQGRYEEIIEHFTTTRPSRESDLTALIGANCFLGNTEKAFEIWRARSHEIEGCARFQTRFFLGVALTRISKFKKARLFFKENLDGAKTTPLDSLPQAYAFQGAGFFAYFQGNYRRAIYWSEKALQEALKSNDRFIEYLATDLLGHGVVQAGRRSHGLRLLREASRLAEKAGNSNFAAAFNDSSLIYEAEAGMRPRAIISELTAALDSSALVDSYTKNNLVLELSRQFTLRGQFEKTEDLLNKYAPVIYAFPNRRQECMLQLRLAELYYLRGEFHSMIHALQSAKKSLPEISDRTFEIRYLGLLLKVPQEISLQEKEIIRTQLLEVSREHSSLINRHILFREGLGKDPRTASGEDPLHDLLLLAENNKDQAKSICLSNGYYGIYARLSNFFPGKEILQILEDGSGFVIQTKAEIFSQKGTLSSLLVKLLRCFLEGPATKESVIKTVWGYEYDSLRHDALVHNTIAKLRKLLGPAAPWIETNEKGWTWNPNALVVFSSKKAPEVENTLRANVSISHASEEELNFRQMRALKTTPRHVGWSVSVYKKNFKVSTMTAFRDLSYLHKMGYLLRSGRGRACRYLRTSEEKV